jgi:hypothetical protein
MFGDQSLLDIEERQFERVSDEAGLGGQPRVGYEKKNATILTQQPNTNKTRRKMVQSRIELETFCAQQPTRTRCETEIITTRPLNPPYPKISSSNLNSFLGLGPFLPQAFSSSHPVLGLA